MIVLDALLFLSIMGAIALGITALVLVSECRSSINMDRTYHSEKISVVSFEQFLSYYKLNPEAYDLDESFTPKRESEDGWSWHEIIIHFDRFSGHLRYFFWRKREIRNRQKRSQCTEKYLKLVMKDIEEMRRLSAKEFEEAQQEIEKVSLSMQSK